MDLIEKYSKRAISFRGLKLDRKQVEMYKTLRDKIRNKESGIYYPQDFRVGRGSGKTTVLMKLAEEFDIPVMLRYHGQASLFQKTYPGIEIFSLSELDSIRGRRSRENCLLIDEGFSPRDLSGLLYKVVGFL